MVPYNMIPEAASGQVWLWTKDGQIGGIYLLSYVENQWWFGSLLYSAHFTNICNCHKIDTVHNLKEYEGPSYATDILPYQWKRIT